MRAQIGAANRETRPVLEEANDHFNQRAQLETKQHVLNAFAKHFLLSEEATATLTSSEEPLDNEFFGLLAKVKKIHQDSKFLLGTEDQRLGIEVLERSSKQLNAGYQKLYRWIQKEFKTLDLENPQIGSKMRSALRVLAERSQLFESCMDSFAENREHILSDTFHAALTGTTIDSDGRSAAKPIEFQAHDPLRYVGDMLAWVHSATVSEREALEVLFIGEGDELAKGMKTGRDNDAWARSGDAPDEIFDGRQALNALVSRDIAGAGRLLRQRIEQVVTSHEDAALVYKIANLIAFYQSTFAKLLGRGAPISKLLDNLEDFTHDHFRANMRDHVSSIQSELTQAPFDTNPPDFLEEALGTMRVLMKSFDGSMAAASGEITAFEPIMTEALDPFLDGCVAQSKHLPHPQNDIFVINCLALVANALRPFQKFTAPRIEVLQSKLAGPAAALTVSQYHFFLSNSGLEPLMKAVSKLTDADSDLLKMPTLDEFSPDKLVAVSQELDDFLPSALMDATDNLKQLRNASMIRDITGEAAERFCEDFEMLEKRMLASDELRGQESQEDDDDDEERENSLLKVLLSRTSGEIRVLLS